jgi:drug/metabolite transporter (DMT)-like permease
MNLPFKKKATPMALLFIFMMLAFTVAGQIFVKQGMLEVGNTPTDVFQIPQFILQALTNIRVVLGFACAFFASVCWLVAISRSELSFAYPFTGLSIVLVLSLAPLFFGEAVPLTRWVGVLIVCLGIWVASR